MSIGSGDQQGFSKLKDICDLIKGTGHPYGLLLHQNDSAPSPPTFHLLTPSTKSPPTPKAGNRLPQAEATGQIDYDSDDSSEWPDDLAESSEGGWGGGDSGETSTSGRDNRRLPEEDSRLLGRADNGQLTSQDEMSLARVAGLDLRPRKPPQKAPQMPLMW